jgi:hypothetical protein
MRPDFSDLYTQLELQPDCSLEDLKRAYQRRVSKLHPDRPDAATTGINLSLAELIALYGAATRFHRRHGRLPGATPRRARNARIEAPTRWPAATRHAEPGSRSTSFPPGVVLIVVLAAALLALAASWDWSLATWKFEFPLPASSRAAVMDRSHAGPAARPATIASATAALQIDWDMQGLLPTRTVPLGPASPLPDRRVLDEACTPVPGARRMPSLFP